MKTALIKKVFNNIKYNEENSEVIQIKAPKHKKNQFLSQDDINIDNNSTISNEEQKV